MRSFLALVVLVAVATAKTDLSGCTSSEVIANGGASYLFYVPGTGEICSFLDCGGGRAPPMTTVPGCPLYTGTATYSPSFLPGFKDGSLAAASSTAYVAAATTTSPSTAMITGSSTTESISSLTTLSEVVTSSSTSTGTATESKTTSLLSHAPPPPGCWIEIDTHSTEYKLTIRLPGFKRDGITLATKRRRVLHVVADSWENGGGHFERRIAFGYDADLIQVRAEFDGEILRVTIPRRISPLELWGSRVTTRQ